MTLTVNLPLNIEVPDTPTKFKLGLMFRESLEEDSGMLFIFEEVGQRFFHMKDTKIPLDIAFVKEDGTIESIKELDPYNILPVASEGEVLYALEVNRGWFTEHNVKVGDTVINLIKPDPIVSPKSSVSWEDMSEARKVPLRRNGQIVDTYLRWRGNNFMLQMFFPHIKKPSRKEVLDQLQKVYPGCKLWNYQISDYKPGDPLIQVPE
jgi:uncharacterized membrane protein (UPF0127 family)